MININRLAIFGSAVIVIATGGLAQVGGLTEQDKAYQRRWSAEEIGTEWLQMEEWIKGEAGLGKGVMPPWTPMEVKGQEIHCWGRIYRYTNTLFPAQVTSLGE